MSWLRQLSFRIQIAIPVIFLGLVLLAIAVVGIRNVSTLDEGSTVIASEYLPGVDLLLQAD